jgi:hypothetical protein
MGPRAGMVAAEEIDPIVIQFDTQAGAIGHLQREVAVGQRRAEDFLRQQQRAEQFGAPVSRGKVANR